MHVWLVKEDPFPNRFPSQQDFYVDVSFKSKTFPEVDRKGISINTMCVDPAP